MLRISCLELLFPVLMLENAFEYLLTGRMPFAKLQKSSELWGDSEGFFRGCGVRLFLLRTIVMPLAVHRDVDCGRVPGDEKSEDHYNFRMVFA